MDAVRLIMSGTMVGETLAAEFGALPPAFLPVGARRLYQLQIANMKGAGPIWLALPESFHPSPYDHARLQALGVEVVAVPEGLRLGAAVAHAIKTLGRVDVPVHVLRGDVLLSRMPTDETDVIVAVAPAGPHTAAEIELADDRVVALETPFADDDGEERPIAAGYFSFSSSPALMRALTKARGDFIGGVNHYLAERDMQVAPAADWLDFGRAETFHHAQLRAAAAHPACGWRIDGPRARRFSADKSKIEAEAAWLDTAPPALKPYCARVLDAGEAGGEAFYETEHDYLPRLSDLFVFGALGRKAWLRILDSCEDFLRLCADHPDDSGAEGDALAGLIENKVLPRLDTFARVSGFPIDRPLAYEGRACPSLTSIAEALSARIKAAPRRTRTLAHGDFGFGSILFNARLGRIKTLGPRGAGSYADTRYDLAKLAQSIVGRHDQIIAGRYCVTASGANFSLGFDPLACQRWLQDALRDLSVGGVRGSDPVARAVMIGLFLSATSAHADRPEQQKALVANALRLFLDLD